MSANQIQFIEFALQANVLRFGQYKTKAGRLSPYFFNAGLFNTGELLNRLAGFYADAIMQACKEGRLSFDMIFGSAYKGIPLAAAVSMTLAARGFGNVPFAYNRKEAKDHGEGGVIVGSPLQGRVLIIDDVISAGTSVRESVDLIRQAGATPAGVSIALDRMEKGGTVDVLTELSAVQEVEKAFDMPVVSIINLKDLLAFMDGDSPAAQASREYKQAVRDYRDRYGVE